MTAALLDPAYPPPPLPFQDLLRHTPWGVVLAARDELARPVDLHGVWGARLPALDRVRRLAPHDDLVAVDDVVPGGRGFAWVVRPAVLRPGVRPLLTALGMGELDREGALEAVALAARAIGHAHRHGVGDGQLKPDALLVARGAPPRVLLGLSGEWTIVGPGGAMRLCGPGYLEHAPTTISPQRLQGPNAAGAIADNVWALGVILFRALADRPPFGGRHVTEIFRAIGLGPPPAPPSTFAEDVHPDLDRVVLRALAHDPAARFPHADALADDLVDALVRGRALLRR